MIRYLYTSQYTAPKPDDKLPALLFHTSVYVIGEVYALSGLKKAAIDAFRQSAKDKVPGHILAPVIQAIYESTPDRDRGLRDAVVQVASKRFKELLVDEKFSAMMDEIGSFGKDILLYTNGLYPPGPMLSVWVEFRAGFDEAFLPGSEPDQYLQMPHVSLLWSDGIIMTRIHARGGRHGRIKAYTEHTKGNSTLAYPLPLI